MTSNKAKFIFIFCALVFIDQISKFIAINHFKNGLFFLRDFFGLEFYQNYGVAFGVEIGNIAAIILTVLFLGLFILFLRKRGWRCYSERGILPLWKRGAGGILDGNSISFLLIFSGAASNLLDRIFRGYVVDFIRFSPILILNFADIFILAGLILLFFHKENKSVI